MNAQFTLTDEQLHLAKFARTFAVEHLTPLAAAFASEPDPEKRAMLARPYMEKAVAAGLLKEFIPAPFGGRAVSGAGLAAAIEELCCVAPDFLISMAGPVIALAPVFEAGTPDQIQRFTAPFLADSGAPLAAMAYSEPGGSANFDAPPPAEGTRTTAYLDGDEWVINGAKAWSSHLSGWDGKGPDVMTIVCRTPGGVSLIAAEREHLANGLTVDHVYDLPGLRGCLTTRVLLENVRVPKDNLIGAEGDGVQLCRNAFFGSGASIAITATAFMRRAFDIAHDFACREKRGGAVRIIEHQAVADLLSDAKGKIEATRLLGWRALDAVVAQSPAGPELALHAKIFGSEMALDVVNSMIKVVGVEAYDNAHPLIGLLHDTLSLTLIEGSNIGVRRRQLQELLQANDFNSLTASGLG
ncbi:acyl-CoA dehydrogenase family protein [Rhodococcus sp. USK13]|uniref:acyl-CoA dehydrogenase family protein n=1 Tax=Rhodococcus sp. USK13 TaxID=2806442 RepID=UPI001BD02FBE|nr:acyl-CoA dehydrogenase family protein [Rhodococcus sp. USK13]